MAKGGENREDESCSLINSSDSLCFEQFELCPVNRSTDLATLRNQFEPHLPSVEVFVSTADPEKEPPLVTADPEKEPPLVTAATILSILAADYPVDRIACYLSDDGASLLTFEAMAEAEGYRARGG